MFGIFGTINPRTTDLNRASASVNTLLHRGRDDKKIKACTIYGGRSIGGSPNNYEIAKSSENK